MSAVTAKAQLNSVELSSSAATLKFIADYGDDRNKEWAAFTPSLSFQMTVKKEIFERHFELGASYTVTFEPDQDAK
jgi:hypothetical protein